MTQQAGAELAVLHYLPAARGIARLQRQWRIDRIACRAEHHAKQQERERISRTSRR